VNRLNLIWRVLGGNILMMLISFLLTKINIQNAYYLFVTNLNLVIIALLHVIRKKMTIISDMNDVLNLYVICLFVVNFCYIETAYHCIMSMLSSLFSSIWIVKFFMLKKSSMQNK